MEFDDNDVHSLALVSWREARGEGLSGIVAVMNAILNRVGFPGFAKTLHDVIFGRNQFTSMSVPSDPQFSLMPSANDALFAMCADNARQLLANREHDITNGAHYYCNPKTATSGWFFRNIVCDPEAHPVTAEIGHHVFYR